MKSHIRCFIYSLILSTASIYANQMESNTTIECPHMIASERLSQTLSCYGHMYDQVEKNSDFFGFIRSIKVVKRILDDTQSMLDKKENIHDRTQLITLLQHLDLSTQRFSHFLEIERNTVKKLYAGRNGKQPLWLRTYYREQLLQSIEKKIDMFFDRLKHAGTFKALEDMKKMYLMQLKRAKEQADESLLNTYEMKAKKKEPLSDSEKEILSDIMLALYLNGKDGQINLISLKEYYLNLGEKRDKLLQRLAK